jgi:hypothetical protein
MLVSPFAFAFALLYSSIPLNEFLGREKEKGIIWEPPSTLFLYSLSLYSIPLKVRGLKAPLLIKEKSQRI